MCPLLLDKDLLMTLIFSLVNIDSFNWDLLILWLSLTYETEVTKWLLDFLKSTFSLDRMETASMNYPYTTKMSTGVRCHFEVGSWILNLLSSLAQWIFPV